MSQIKSPKSAKLVVGFFLHDKQIIDDLSEDLESFFGSIDMVSRWISFDYTSYYTKEMGTPLYRRVFVFKRLIDQFDLAKFKLIAYNLEKKYTELCCRLVNIDPGYLLAERFVLATGKNYSHRIYIGLGIYADLTLIYRNGNFQVLPWTYPDYIEKNLQKFLLLVRNKYIVDLKRMSFGDIL